MPINTDQVYESIQFKYVHELDDSFVLDVEFHHTDMGPTITLHNLLDSGPLPLPVSLYVEVVDYLRKRGAIAGGAPAPMTQAGGMMRTPQRLQPTRTVSNAPQMRASHVVQQSPAGPNQDGPVYQQPPTESALSAYTSQHGILTSQSSFEGSRQAQHAAPQTGLPNFNNNADILENAPDPTDERLDPAFTLEAAKAKKENTIPRRTMKRIVKPGEPEFGG
jgi:hypothetical protein